MSDELRPDAPGEMAAHLADSGDVPARNTGRPITWADITYLLTMWGEHRTKNVPILIEGRQVYSFEVQFANDRVWLNLHYASSGRAQDEKGGQA